MPPALSHPGVIVRSTGLRPGSYQKNETIKIPAANRDAGMTKGRGGALVNNISIFFPCIVTYDLEDISLIDSCQFECL